MLVSEFLLTTFLGLGVDIAKKGVVFLYSTREGKRILKKSIKKTSQRFKGYAPGGEKAVKQYLEIWVQTTEFKKSLIALEKGSSVEESLQDAYQEFNRISISNLHVHSDKVLVFLFEQIKEGIIDSSKGVKYLLNFIIRKVDDLGDKSGTHNEELKKLILESHHDTLEYLKSGKDAFNENQRRAIDNYLAESQNWGSYKSLLEKGAYKLANKEIQKRLSKLDELYGSYSRSDELFKDHHIELLLKQASLHSNLGNFKEAENLYSKAKNKTIKGSYLKRLESKVLLNLNRIDEFEALVNENEISEKEIAKAELLMLKDEWDPLLKLIPEDTENFRLIYLGIIGKLEGYDDQNLSVKSAEISDEIQKASTLTGTQPIHKIQVADVAVKFLRKITFGMLEAEGVKRQDLVNRIRKYINEAIRVCKEVEYQRGLSIILDYGLMFYSLLEEEEEIASIEVEKQKINETDEFLYEFDLKRGAISKALELHNKAVQIFKSSRISQQNTIEHLFQAAFELAEKEEKQIVGKSLINFYLQVNELDKAREALLKLYDINEHSKKLIEFIIIEKEESISNLLTNVEELINQFPLSIQFRRYYSDLLVQSIVDNIENADNNNDKYIENLRENTEVLNKLLPTDSSVIPVAKALASNKQFNKAIEVLKEVSPDSSVRITALKMMAHCLIKMERTNEAPDVLIQLAKLTNDPNHANEAARYLIIDNKDQEAVSLLNEWVNKYPNHSELLANYGLSIISNKNVTKEDAGIALEALEKSNALTPGLPNIFLIMSRAAKIAGDSKKYQEYQHKYWSSIPLMEVNSKEDFYSIDEKMSQGAIRFDLKGSDGIKAFIDWDNEFKKALNTFYENDLMSYIDTFARNGQPWGQWIAWTSKADNEYYEIDFSTAIKSPWTYTRALDIGSKGILLDITALLSLCVLTETESILRELNDGGIDLFLRSNELKSLRNALSKPEQVFWDVVKTPYDELYTTLKQNCLVNNYSHKQWNIYHEVVPEELKKRLGNHTSDFGLSISLDKSLFVLDKDDGMNDENEEVFQKLTSSKVLLKSLVENGVIGINEANIAESKNHRFRDWKNSEIIDLPKNVVFSAFSIQHWYETGLLTLEKDSWIKGADHWPKIHLGPFGVNHIRIEAGLVDNDKRVDSLAAKQLESIEQAIKEGSVSVLPDIEYEDDKDLAFFEGANVNALKLMELAKVKNLNLWTDDRVLGYILWPFDHPLPFQELRDEIKKLRRKYSSLNYFTTEDIFQQIHKSDHHKEFAEKQGYRLVELGYRPLNFQLAVSYLLNNFSYNPTLPKYKSFITTLEGFLIHKNYDPDSKIDIKPQQRLLIGRVLPSVLAHILLNNTNCTLKGRKKFATDTLSALFKYVKQHRQEMRGVGSFWVSLLHEIVEYQWLNNLRSSEDQAYTAILDQALEWFGDILSELEAEEELQKVVLEIEDYIVLSIKKLKELNNTIPSSIAETVNISDIERQVELTMSKKLVLLLRPLLHKNIIEKFNPLLRRCLGHISLFDHEFKLDQVYEFNEGTKKAQDNISEDELEGFAIEVLEDILNGREEYNEFLTGDLRVFCNWNRLKPKDFQHKDDKTYALSINISLLRLLLRDELHKLPTLLNAIVTQLQLIDPILGHDIQTLSEELTSDLPEVRKIARRNMAFAIVSSVYFELQRNLLHAFSNLQKLETNELDRFLAPGTGWAPKPHHPAIFDFNNKEFPRAMQVELSFLTLPLKELYQNGNQTIKGFQTDVAKESNFDGIAFYTSILEEEISSFKFGYRLLEFLIWLSNGVERVTFNGEKLTSKEYVKKLLLQILSYKIDDSNEETEGYRSKDLKVIYCSLLRLATFVNGSAKHVSSWEKELNDDNQVLLNIIHSNLIFTNRILPFLSAKYNKRISDLKVDLVEIVRNLSIHYDNSVEYPDRFNPLILGPHLLDQEMASIMHSLTAFITFNDNPELILDLSWLLSLIAPWTKSQSKEAEEIYEKQKRDSSDVLKLSIPLSPREAAKILSKAIKDRLNKDQN